MGKEACNLSVKLKTEKKNRLRTLPVATRSQTKQTQKAPHIASTGDLGKREKGGEKGSSGNLFQRLEAIS